MHTDTASKVLWMCKRFLAFDIRFFCCLSFFGINFVHCCAILELDPQPFQPGMHTESNTWTTGNTDNTVATAPQPESCPMMSIASASAPWEEAEDDNSMMTWPASGLRDAPPSYDTVSARVERQAPPVYEDLFPISKTWLVSCIFPATLSDWLAVW